MTNLVIDHAKKTITLVSNLYVNEESLERAKAAIKKINSENRYQYEFYDRDLGKLVTYDIKYQINEPIVVKDPMMEASKDPKGNSFMLITMEEKIPTVARVI